MLTCMFDACCFATIFELIFLNDHLALWVCVPTNGIFEGMGTMSSETVTVIEKIIIMKMSTDPLQH